MAITPNMSARSEKTSTEDAHELDIVMPGFRFHPTEEELIEFYLRRKVEGRRFNVELITFLDLYRHDPWELPALASIGEKEWFFYVPRDRKYRNGDRPNRVTMSGYWKATGADRMIRAESAKPIGLKKTLVFYSGKAPRGTRTSWIMNEYRLPQNETSQSLKAEISLCRVYKRPGVPGDHHHHHLPAGSLQPRSLASSRPSLLDKKTSHRAAAPFPSLSSEPSSSSDIITHTPASYLVTGSPTPLVSGVPVKVQAPDIDSYMSTCTLLGFAASSSTSMPMATVEELNRLMGFHQQGPLTPPQPHTPQLLGLLPPTPGAMEPCSQEKFWDWNPMP